MSQKHTSQNTSINSAKLPAIYTKMAAKMENKIFVDYGCGKYTDHLEKFADAHDGYVLFYDPYNQPCTVNDKTKAIAKRHADFAICSNVLNVIDDDGAVYECIRRAVALGRGEAWFTVYEGDRTGIGRETQNGQSWQRNLKLSAYVWFVPDTYTVTFEHGMMHVINPAMK